MGFTRGAGAVVTGAGSGLGRAVAEELARRGLRVLASDIEGEGLSETVHRIRQEGGVVHQQTADVRDVGAITALKERADHLFGGVEVLVNNAGVAVGGITGEVPIDDWHWQLDINLRGVIYGCHTFLPDMRAKQHGYVLNVASIAGIVAAPRMAPYNVSKAGVIALSETLAAESAGDGIHVSVLCPAFFRSGIHTRARAGKLSATTERLITQARWTSPQVAKAALRDLERGRLYIMPQLEAKAFWWSKRLLGPAYYKLLGRVFRSNLLKALEGASARKRSGEKRALAPPA